MMGKGMTKVIITITMVLMITSSIGGQVVEKKVSDGVFGMAVDVDLDSIMFLRFKISVSDSGVMEFVDAQGNNVFDVEMVNDFGDTVSCDLGMMQGAKRSGRNLDIVDFDLLPKSKGAADVRFEDVRALVDTVAVADSVQYDSAQAFSVVDWLSRAVLRFRFK